ncbi:MAG: hypothetical protein KBD47_02490 [Candidatus Pacebacteria bacterium]|nr:hypothetical protein [Candidatus Paceibacterota bacterium]
MKKTALLKGISRLNRQQDPIDLGTIEFDTESHKQDFIPATGFEKWVCELEQNTLGHQDRDLPDGLSLRITPLGQRAMVTFKNDDNGAEQNFLLTPDSIDRYRSLYRQ